MCSKRANQASEGSVSELGLRSVPRQNDRIWVTCLSHHPRLWVVCLHLHPTPSTATREARCIPHSPQGTPALLAPASPPRGTACSAPVHPPPGRMKPGHALLRCFASWVLPHRRSWVGLCHAPVCACASTSARVSSRRWVMVTTPYSFAS